MSIRFLSASGLVLIGLLSISFIGCQNPDEPIVSTIESAKTKTQPVVQADISTICRNLEQKMAEVDAQRTMFALERVNQELRICVPLMTYADQKKLMQASNRMYQRFLKVERSPEQQHAFEHYALEMAQHPTIQQHYFEQLSARDQYLLKHKGQAYVELADYGAEQLQYRRTPDYLARIFAPYLPEDEREFIQLLATQNTEIFINDDLILLETHELTNRASAWRDYLDQYPQSNYHEQAQYLFNRYISWLYIGCEKQPLSDDFQDIYSIPSDHIDAIQALANASHPALSEQAKRYLHFLAMSQEQRLASLPQSMHIQSPRLQLQHYIRLPDPSEMKPMDCFHDAICLAS